MNSSCWNPTDEHNNASVLPVPVGLSNKAFWESFAAFTTWLMMPNWAGNGVLPAGNGMRTPLTYTALEANAVRGVAVVVVARVVEDEEVAMVGDEDSVFLLAA